MRGLKHKPAAIPRPWMTALLSTVAALMAALRDAGARGQAHKVRLATESVRELNNLFFIMLEQAESPGITQQLLKLSRKELAGSEDVNLNETVREATETLHRRGGAQIRYQLRLDANPGVVRANHEQMKQVLMNLMANAHNAMAGGGIVTIETRDANNLAAGVGENATEPFVVLRVSDTGVGISPEKQVHLFEPSLTTHRSGKRTGLGLAVVHRIITNTGGTIRVESEPGKGTTFTIQIPWAGAAVPGMVTAGRACA